MAMMNAGFMLNKQGENGRKGAGGRRREEEGGGRKNEEG